MKKVKLLNVAFVVCLLFISCSSSRDGQIAPLSRGEIQNMSNSSNTPFVSYTQIKQGDEWDITLSENPTTGYSWLLYISGSGSIATLYDDYIIKEYEDDEPLLGQGGFHSWHFKAGEKGNVTLTFSYQRPWENNAPIEKRTYNYTII